MTPEDHYVVSENIERQGSALRLVADGLHALALPPLDHAHARFRLPPLTVDLLWEVDNVLNLAHIDRRALPQEGCVDLTYTPFRRREPYAERISELGKRKSVGSTG